MNKFLKHVNRGLILGGVLVLGTASYVAIDKIRFEKEKDNIEDTLQEYFDAFGKLEVYSAKSAEEAAKKAWEKERLDLLYQNVSDVMNQYWISEQTLGGFNSYSNKEELLNNFKEEVQGDEKMDLTGSVDEIETSISRLKISKTGPGYAKAAFEVQMKVTTNGYSFYYYPDYFSDAYVVDEKKFEVMEIGDHTGVEKSMSGQYQMELKLVGNDWKIVGSAGYLDEKEDTSFREGEK